MNFSFLPEQQMLQDSVRRYVEKDYGFEARNALLGAGGGHHWKAFAENGWLAATLPETYGGLDGTLIDAALIAQEFGRGLVLEPYLGCAVLAAQTLVAGGTPRQCEQWLPSLADGSRRLALAYSEIQARGFAEPLHTRAESVADGYRLHGEKTLVLGGADADGYVVSAKVPGTDGITLFLVEANCNGLTRRAVPLHDGRQAAELVFNDVVVGQGAVVGTVGHGLPALGHGLSCGIAVLCAELVGAMEKAIELTADYLKVRHQFGVAIGSFQALQHPIDKQTVVRPNRDTLYSAGVFDLDAGPVTISLPDAGKRFMSLVFINEDHYALAVHYGAGHYAISKKQAGTRYVLAGIRTFVDPSDPKDMERVHTLQDAVKVEQAGKGQFDAPSWDAASQKKVRDALLVLGGTLLDAKRMYGAKEQVDPVRHLIGTASGWGGNPEKDATYVTVTPPKNDGNTIYRLTVKDVPVDGFWSVSVYNANGYLEPNPYNAYTLNNITATKGADGTVAVQFGGCDGKIPNCLPVVSGWNYWVRLYRPRAEILDGKWTFPEPVEVQ